MRRGSDFGWRVDVMKSWTSLPTGQWFILKVKVTNPYPTAKAQAKVAHLDASQLKPVTVQCSVYDANGNSSQLSRLPILSPTHTTTRWTKPTCAPGTAGINTNSIGFMQDHPPVSR